LYQRGGDVWSEGQVSLGFAQGKVGGIEEILEEETVEMR
jgi:hypothetical protein